MDFKLFWVGIFIFLIACNPSDYRDPRNKCEWFLKNSTGSTIILLKNFDSPNYNIVLNDSTITVYGAGISSFEETPDMFNWILDAIVLEDSLTIFDSNNVLLRTWVQSQRNDSGKQFFNEQYWQKREWKEGKYTYHEWTFELLPEDLEIKEQD